VTAPGAVARLRSPSWALRRAATDPVVGTEVSIRRRLGWIWGLMFVNVLPYSAVSPVLHMPTSMGKVVTQGALALALLLALSINPKVLLRPNLFLLLMSVLCVTSMMMSVRGYFGLGSTLRAGRLVAVVVVLWLLTPWWGRRDLLLFRFHLRAIYVVLAIVLLGVMVAPGPAFDQAGGGRLGGAIWPIPPTQVAEYAAVLTGLTVVLWFTGLMRARTAGFVALAGTAMLLLTHTRTALVGLLVAVLVAALSLLVGRKRVRTTLGVTVLICGLIALSAAPFLSNWFTRGESPQELASFTGRSTVWSALAAQPRSELHTVLGYGMSNDSFGGRSIDSSWYSAYLDQGLVGDVIDGGILVALLVTALLRPRGPRRAIALFLVTYCCCASFTETGLGQASPYLLDLAIAASVLLPPVVTEPALRALPGALPGRRVP
jgi:hypothetical protein